MRPARPRSIIAMAEEEASLAWKKRKVVWTRLAWVAAAVLQGFGWWFLKTGRTAQGSRMVLGGLAAWALLGGVLSFFRGTSISAGLGLLAATGTGFFLGIQRATCFQWGHDSSFYLAALQGTVPPPFAGPLAYLTAQAFLPFLKSDPWPDLPLLTVLAAGLASGLLVYSVAEDLRSKGWEARFLGLGFALAVPFTLPFLGWGTQASGLTVCLALSLLLVLRRLMEIQGALPANFLLVGLLFSLHPAWAVLGLGFLFRKPWETLTRLPARGGWILAGLTPMLWIVLRAHGSLGDWGGDQPFGEILRSWDDLLAIHRGVDWNLPETMKLLGGALALWVGPLFLIGWKFPGAPGQAVQVLLALAGAWFFHSHEGGLPGTTALWIPVAATFWWVAGLSAKPPGGAGAVRALRSGLWVLFAGVLGWVGFSARQAFAPNSLAPLRHAENILSDLGKDGKRVLYLAETSPEAESLRLLQLVEKPLAVPFVVLDLSQFEQRWYLEDMIRYQSEVLLSVGEGGRAKLFSDLVRLNLNSWSVVWGVPRWPVDWTSEESRLGFRPLSRVLTVRLADPNITVPADDPSARYDLGELLQSARGGSRPAQDALDRYVEGLYNWGVDQTRVGRYPPAVRAFERSLALRPDFDESRAALDRLYSEKSMLEAARLQFERTAKSLPPQLQALDKQLVSPKTPAGVRPALLEQKARLSAELSDALHHLGLIYSHQGRFDESRAALEAAVKWKPDAVNSRLELARLLLRVGNKAGAEAAYKSVLKVDQENKEAQAELWKLLNQP